MEKHWLSVVLVGFVIYCLLFGFPWSQSTEVRLTDDNLPGVWAETLPSGRTVRMRFGNDHSYSALDSDTPYVGNWAIEKGGRRLILKPQSKETSLVYRVDEFDGSKLAIQNLEFSSDNSHYTRVNE